MELLKTILQLPERSLVNRKITKAFFKRNFQLVLSEKKMLDDATIIIQMDWLASLKPEQINVAAYSDQQTVFEEIQVIAVQTSEENFEKNHHSIISFVQKFLPYHLLLCVYNQAGFVINTCTKRLNQNDSSKRTIEKNLITETIAINTENPSQVLFLNNLAFDKLDKQNLQTLYNSYNQSIIALQTANIVGTYQNRPLERSQQDVANLELMRKKEAEIASLEAKAKNEIQLNEQVKINTDVYRLRKEIETIKEQLR